MTFERNGKLFTVRMPRGPPTEHQVPHNFFFFFITLGLELSGTKVYEP